VFEKREQGNGRQKKQRAQVVNHIGAHSPNPASASSLTDIETRK
jgi:hypothetical protein